MKNLVLLSIVPILGFILLFQVGVFDRPPLQEAIIDADFYLFIASTTNKDIGGTVMRLLTGTKDAIGAVTTAEQLSTPAALYGSPVGSEALSVGLYFDDPMAEEHPRWGVGWAIQANSSEEADELLKQVTAASELPEPFRLIKVEKGRKVLRGRIPWRTSITPAVAPMLHWGRYFKDYVNGGYSSDGGGPNDEGSVALEVYVTGPNGAFEWIDYIVLMGDTASIFDGMFPPNTGSEKQEARED